MNQHASESDYEGRVKSKWCRLEGCVHRFDGFSLTLIGSGGCFVLTSVCTPVHPHGCSSRVFQNNVALHSFQLPLEQVQFKKENQKICCYDHINSVISRACTKYITFPF